ncbi:MAG: hypothetical protein ACLT61_04305 [Anaerostipes hadrus]
MIQTFQIQRWKEQLLGRKIRKDLFILRKIKGYFFYHKYDARKKILISMDGDPQLTHFTGRHLMLMDKMAMIQK